MTVTKVPISSLNSRWMIQGEEAENMTSMRVTKSGATLAMMAMAVEIQKTRVAVIAVVHPRARRK